MAMATLMTTMMKGIAIKPRVYISSFSVFFFLHKNDRILWCVRARYDDSTIHIQQYILCTCNVALLLVCKCQITINFTAKMKTRNDNRRSGWGKKREREKRKDGEWMRSDNSRKQLHYGTEPRQIGCCMLFFLVFFISFVRLFIANAILMFICVCIMYNVHTSTVYM